MGGHFFVEPSSVIQMLLFKSGRSTTGIEKNDDVETKSRLLLGIHIQPRLQNYTTHSNEKAWASKLWVILAQ